MPTEQTVYVVDPKTFDRSVENAVNWGEVFDVDKEKCTYKVKLHAIDAEESTK